MSSFFIYLTGFPILAAGILLGAHYPHVAHRRLSVMGLIIAEFGVPSGAAKIRRRDASAASELRCE